MPLKHSTETRLVGVLGLAIIVTGFLTATLPPLLGGLVPWVILFIFALLYPVALYPMFRRNRADNTFRYLHWLPAGMLALWLLLELLSLVGTGLDALVGWYTWAWAFIPVTLGFAWLIGYCVQVVRQRMLRIIFLTVVYVVYAALALTSVWSFQLERQVMAALWEGEWSQLFEEAEPDDIALEDDVNVDPSDDPSEEQWRSSLRAVQERDGMVDGEDSEGEGRSFFQVIGNRIFSQTGAVVGEIDSEGSASSATHSEASASSEESMIADLPDALEPGGTGAHLREVRTPPKKLPDSGLGLGALLLTMAAGYCGVLHDRARRRV